MRFVGWQFICVREGMKSGFYPIHSLHLSFVPSTKTNNIWSEKKWQPKTKNEKQPNELLERKLQYIARAMHNVNYRPVFNLHTFYLYVCVFIFASCIFAISPFRFPTCNLIVRNGLDWTKRIFPKEYCKASKKNRFIRAIHPRLWTNNSNKSD